MTPPPTDPGQAQNLLTDASTYGGLGALAMFARWLVSPTKPGWFKLLCGVCAAAIIAIFAGFALDSFVESTRLKYALIGVVSYFNDKVMGFVGAYVTKLGERYLKD
jgi:hypothetical protein